MKTAVIVQARMGSTRLPGKMLMDLAGRPVIQWVVDRARLIDGAGEVLVATSGSGRDDPLADFCAAHGVPVYRGSEADVLGRYAGCARHAGADVVVRITGDCPFIDPRESARVLERFMSTPSCDYASNIEPPTLPDGLDTEVIRATTLLRLAGEVSDPVLREHVTLHVRRFPERYAVAAVVRSPDLSHLRWTLDEPADYELLRRIAGELDRRGQTGTVDEIAAIVREHPELPALNRHLRRSSALLQEVR